MWISVKVHLGVILQVYFIVGKVFDKESGVRLNMILLQIWPNQAAWKVVLKYSLQYTVLYFRHPNLGFRAVLRTGNACSSVWASLKEFLCIYIYIKYGSLSNGKSQNFFPGIFSRNDQRGFLYLLFEQLFLWLYLIFPCCKGIQKDVQHLPPAKKFHDWVCFPHASAQT